MGALTTADFYYALTPSLAEDRRALVDFRKVRMDKGRVRLELPGMALDLGGLAKGAAIDAAVERLRSLGVPAGIVEAWTESGGGPAAVRSSGSGEDGEGASAAAHPPKTVSLPQVRRPTRYSRGRGGALRRLARLGPGTKKAPLGAPFVRNAAPGQFCA